MSVKRFLPALGGAAITAAALPFLGPAAPEAGMAATGAMGAGAADAAAMAPGFAAGLAGAEAPVALGTTAGATEAASLAPAIGGITEETLPNIAAAASQLTPEAMNTANAGAMLSTAGHPDLGIQALLRAGSMAPAAGGSAMSLAPSVAPAAQTADFAAGLQGAESPVALPNPMGPGNAPGTNLPAGLPGSDATGSFLDTGPGQNYAAQIVAGDKGMAEGITGPVDLAKLGGSSMADYLKYVQPLSSGLRSATDVTKAALARKPVQPAPAPHLTGGVTRPLEFGVPPASRISPLERYRLMLQGMR